jgi:hypothetical protein
MGAVGIFGGLFALYVRLTLSDFIVKILDERYPTREIFDLKFEQIHNALQLLPCRTGKICLRPEGD